MTKNISCHYLFKCLVRYISLGSVKCVCLLDMKNWILFSGKPLGIIVYLINIHIRINNIHICEQTVFTVQCAPC